MVVKIDLEKAYDKNEWAFFKEEKGERGGARG